MTSCLSVSEPEQGSEAAAAGTVKTQIQNGCYDSSGKEAILSRVRYLSPEVEAGQSCRHEIQQRACVAGELTSWSGTYLHSSCFQAQEQEITYSSQYNFATVDLDDVYGNQNISTALRAEMVNATPATFSLLDRAIFEEYKAADKSTYSSNWTSAFDFSGVAWDHAKAGVLITNKHILMSSQYSRAIGSSVVFHDRNGNRVIRRIVAKQAVVNSDNYRPDVTVAKLDRAVPTTVAIYPLLEEARESDLEGAPLIVTDKNRNAYIHMIDTVSNGEERSIIAKKDNSLPGFMSKYATAGDTGNPMFMIVNGKLVLMGMQTFAGYGNGGYLGNPLTQRDIDDIIAEL